MRRRDRWIALGLSLGLVAAMSGAATAAPPAPNHKGCATIKDGTLVDSAGNPIVTGYDQFGYDYQAHMFNGTYDSVDRNLDGTYWGSTGDFVDDKLMMKWSDAWLANVDCGGDGKLDRGLGTPGTVSRGWLTNHVKGDYSDANGVQALHGIPEDRLGRPRRLPMAPVRHHPVRPQ